MPFQRKIIVTPTVCLVQRFLVTTDPPPWDLFSLGDVTCGGDQLLVFPKSGEASGTVYGGPKTPMLLNRDPGRSAGMICFVDSTRRLDCF